MIKKTKIVKLNLSVLGVYIRVARIEAGISLRKLATLTNISHTLISNIEKGKQAPSEETLKDIMNALDLKLNTSDDVSTSMAYYYKNIFSNILNYKYDAAKEFVDELESKSQLFLTSLEVVNYHIIRSLYYAITNTKAVRDEIMVYEPVIQYLSPEQQQLIFLIKGVECLSNSLYSEAEIQLEKAIEIGRDEIDVFINEYLVRAYLKQYKFTNSVSLCNKVIEEYEKRTNYLRAMRCRLLIAKVYLTIMRFDQVITLVDHVAQFAEQFTLQYLLDNCYVMRAEVYFYKNSYEKAINELNKVVDTSTTGYAYTKFRVYLVNKDIRLVGFYNEIIKDEYSALSESSKLLIKILMKWQNKDYRDDTYISEINELKTHSVKGNSQELIGLTYNLLIEYYKEDRKYKKALEISEELLKLKKIHITHYSIKPSTI
ncbi:helix-turn-helix protein [Candidatus Izimaplasma bacterium HR1]|jgi:transcriptional regulator with XRE-family HTH domain|uniref:helix-turn-helix domain-containing protein n=1 Tax=Candidatus Izimoplasma sp. HR1 TaxID=1541959 RepID=UPI0004F85FAD|nr:helix-turn-helix protein [Candidatus Izimaplasma bacterium HR1]